MYISGVGKEEFVEIDHSFPWDDWVHKATIVELGFYTCSIVNVMEQFLSVTFGGMTFSDLFMSRRLGRRTKK